MIKNYYNRPIGRLKSSLERKYPKQLEEVILPGSIYLYDKLMLRKSRRKTKGYLSQDSFPLFKTIEIETINRCNGACSFCPVNKDIDPRPFKLMNEDLFNLIIQQLKDINYSGSIGLYSNNEPLLDKRIFDFLQIARDNLPGASLYLFTNGKLLTIEKFERLMKYLDSLIIDNYNDDLVLNKSVSKVYEYALTKSYRNKVHIYLRKENEVLLNRSGQAENRSKNSFRLKSACIYPFEQMVVRPDGKISLCCNDATGKVTLGDLTKDKLIDVWNGQQYYNVRRNMVTNRNLNPLCRDCDCVLTSVIGDVAL
ncbi:SPASM domain-containing protein [Wukongibacter baidiensis]|uniref:radical SAM/SPASM domain-containing protein n=1 Tax=Wukongibacter baidiensis TaxID=1723361 RepID=UPI003D7FE018